MPRLILLQTRMSNRTTFGKGLAIGKDRQEGGGVQRRFTRRTSTPAGWYMGSRLGGWAALEAGSN